MLAIRALTLADEARVLELNAGARPNVAALDRAELARLQALSRVHLVAVDADVVLGYALSFASSDAYDGEEFLTLKSLMAEPFVYIDQVVVLPSVQGNGIGRRLYEALERAAWRRGIHWLCCEVNTTPPNPGSLAFHGRLGFSELAPFATRDGRSVVLLRKRLSVAARNDE